jgi:hypothetical protein
MLLFYILCVAMLPEANSPRSGKRERERKWSSQKLTRHLAVALIGAARLGQI